MGPRHAVRACLADYATFTGRSRRSEFWWFTGMSWGVITLLSAAGYAWGSEWFLMSDIFGMATALPTYAVLVRRLHDADFSGKWLWLILTGVGILVLLAFALMRSRAGANAYGPPPTSEAVILEAPSAYPGLRIVTPTTAQRLRVVVWSGLAVFFVSTYLPGLSNGWISQTWADVVLFASPVAVIWGLVRLRATPLTPRLAHRPRWAALQ